MRIKIDLPPACFISRAGKLKIKEPLSDDGRMRILHRPFLRRKEV